MLVSAHAMSLPRIYFHRLQRRRLRPCSLKGLPVLLPVLRGIPEGSVCQEMGVVRKKGWQRKELRGSTLGFRCSWAYGPGRSGRSRRSRRPRRSKQANRCGCRNSRARRSRSPRASPARWASPALWAQWPHQHLPATVGVCGK